MACQKGTGTTMCSGRTTASTCPSQYAARVSHPSPALTLSQHSATPCMQRAACMHVSGLQGCTSSHYYRCMHHQIWPVPIFPCACLLNCMIHRCCTCNALSEVLFTRYAHDGTGGPSDPPRGPLELWVADAETGAARSLLKGLNTIFDECASWL